MHSGIGTVFWLVSHSDWFLEYILEDSHSSLIHTFVFHVGTATIFQILPIITLHANPFLLKILPWSKG